MKYLIILFTLFSFNLFSQDVIYKKDGSKVEAKVIEITTSAIKYKLWDQQDGPVRNISITDVKEIIYNDGTWDNFENVEIEKEPSTETRDTRRPPPGPRRPSRDSDKDPIGASGFFLDFLPGVGITTFTNIEVVESYDQFGYYYYTEELVTRSDIHPKFGFRIGNKWYLGGSGNFQTGIQANWVEIGIMFDGDFPSSLFYGPKTISIVNAGSANVLRFNDRTGLEMNLTTGYNFDIRPDYSEYGHGVNLNIETKFRYKMLGVGLDYRHVFGVETSGFTGDWDIISLVVGLKF